MQTFNIHKTLCLAVLFFGLWRPEGALADAQPANVVVGISPNLSKDLQPLVFANLRNWLLSLPSGVKFAFANGGSGAIVTWGTVPKLIYDTPQSRMIAMATNLVPLRDWVSHPPEQAGLAINGVNPPLFLPAAVKYLGSGGKPVVLLVGSQLYASGEEGFEFGTNLVPDFSQIGMSDLDTPFGCANHKSLLAGVAVHWWLLPADGVVREKFAKAVENWWRVWIEQGQHGVLGQFSADWTAVNSGLFMPAEPAAPIAAELLKSQGQVPVMDEVIGRKPVINHPVQVSAPAANAAPKKVVPPVEEPPVALALPVENKPELQVHVVVASPRPPEPVVNPPVTPVVAMADPAPTPSVPPPTQIEQTTNSFPAPPMEIPPVVNRSVSSIGIRWTAPNHQDLDLSARLKPGTTQYDPGELYWNTPPVQTIGPKINALGRYLGDIREGGPNSDYEWLELSPQTSISSLGTNYQLWVDHFAGSGPVTFTVALVEKGTNIAQAELTITGDGDKRADATSREHSASWQLIPISKILEQSGAAQSVAK